MKYMLDTNICIYIIKKKPRKVLDTLKTLEIGDVCISTITLAELEYGVNKSQQEDVIFGEIRASLEKRGQIIGAYDLLIAAHALSKNLILITNNTGEFSRIPGLSLQNWAD